MRMNLVGAAEDCEWQCQEYRVRSLGQLLQGRGVSE